MMSSDFYPGVAPHQGIPSNLADNLLKFAGDQGTETGVALKSCAAKETSFQEHEWREDGNVDQDDYDMDGDYTLGGTAAYRV